MKRFYILFCLTLLLAACNRVAEVDMSRSLNISLDIAGQNRVALVDNRYTWQGDEQLGLYISSATPTQNAVSTVTVKDGVGYTTAAVADYLAGDVLSCYMPYSTQSGDAHSVTLTIPAEQSAPEAGIFPKDAMPMVAEPKPLTDGGEVSLKMYPLGSFFCFRIYASTDYSLEKVVSVRYATSRAIAGSVKHDITSAELDLAAMNSYSVKTTLDSSYALPKSLEQAIPIYTAVAPGDYSGVLTITTDAAIYSYNYSREVERNKYYNVNIDLSKAKYRKSLVENEISATLTYDECKDEFSSYGSAKSYTNSYGTWTICAYNEQSMKAIQLNSGSSRVAYIGTPTFGSTIRGLKVSFTGSTTGNLYLCSSPGSTSAVEADILKTIPLSNDDVDIDVSDLNAKQFYIRSEKCVRITSLTLLVGDSDNGEVLPDPEPMPEPEPEPEPEPDPTPEPQPIPSDAKLLPYTESFATSEGDFVVENVQLGGLTDVWKHSTYKEKSYMAASAFMNDKAYATESWLISPPISLVDVESPKLSFEHAHKYADDPAKEFTLWIAEYDSENWTKLTIPTYGSNTDWTFVKSGDIALDSYVGKVVKVAFKYISTTSNAGTWEVCNFSVTGTVNGGNTTPTPDPDPDPTPTPTPDPTPTEGRYNWAELPVMYDADENGVHDTDGNIYYAHHLCAGGEKNAQRNGTARNYTVCYSGKHHCPIWVAAPRHKSYESGASRTDAYAKDPKIPSDVQYNSKSTGGGCNKGHMLGSAERLSSTATNKQVFYYTNIAPQYSDTFNTGGGAWNNLEDHIDGLVCSDTLYVVIGCYFDAFSKNGASASPKTISYGGRDDVSCPTMFYYALLRTKKGNSGKSVHECSESELQCAAFTICHKMPKGHKPEAADMMSISELEALTGVKYFQNVPQAPKGSYSASDWL